jgi:hypothetical protein
MPAGRNLGAAIRYALLAVAAAAILPQATRAEEPSITCSVEYTRRMAIAASDYANASPPDRFWVAHDNQTLGPWTAIEIKREMHLGRLPGGIYIHDSARNDGWEWSAQSTALDPLPADPTLGPDDLGAGLRALLTGCWVSDPFVEAPGEETLWLLMLFDNGSIFPSRGRTLLASGEEGFWFSRTSNAAWSATGPAGAGAAGTNITLTLPDIAFYDPVDDFPARVIDRNTLVIGLPGTSGVTFRRM